MKLTEYINEAKTIKTPAVKADIKPAPNSKDGLDITLNLQKPFNNLQVYGIEPEKRKETLEKITKILNQFNKSVDELKNKIQLLGLPF